MILFGILALLGTMIAPELSIILTMWVVLMAFKVVSVVSIISKIF